MSIFGGTAQIWTGEWEFCRLLPYHLATVPYANKERGSRSLSVLKWKGANRSSPDWEICHRQISFDPSSRFLLEPGRRNGLKMERVTRLELATSTLARWRSTGWATPASLVPTIGIGTHAFKMVPPVGIEPTTRGFSVRCSTNWATEAYWGRSLPHCANLRLYGDPERTRTVDLQRDRLAC